MTLSSEDKLGPYEIVEAICQGGVLMSNRP